MKQFPFIHMWTNTMNEDIMRVGGDDPFKPLSSELYVSSMCTGFCRCDYELFRFKALHHSRKSCKESLSESE